MSILGACAGCKAKDAELDRASAREAALLSQLHQVTNLLSAHADTKAHLAATRQPAPEREERERTKARLPAYVNTLSGHLNIRDLRARVQQKRDRTKPPVVPS